MKIAQRHLQDGLRMGQLLLVTNKSDRIGLIRTQLLFLTKVTRVKGSGVGEQRLQYLKVFQEGLDSFKDQIFVRANEHSAMMMS